MFSFLDFQSNGYPCIIECNFRFAYPCIDIAIVVRGLTRELKQEIISKVVEIESTYFIPLSTIVISEDDFNLLKKRERRLALDIEKEGIPL